TPYRDALGRQLSDAHGRALAVGAHPVRDGLARSSRQKAIAHRVRSYKSMRSCADGLERRLQTPRYAMLGGGFQPRLQRQLRGIESRQDLAAEAFDQRVLLPLRPLAQRVHGRARLGALAHALERLVVLVFQERVEAGGLRLVV